MALMVLLERLMSIALVHWVATKSLETIEKCFIHDYAMIPYITARFCGTKKHRSITNSVARFLEAVMQLIH